MKKLLLFLIPFSQLVFAADPLVHLLTGDATGGRFIGGEILKPVNFCEYIVAEDYYDKDAYRILLTSDENAATGFALTLKKEKLPLHEGDIIKTSDFVMRYKNGFLKAKRIERDGLLFIEKDYLTLKVSPDLKQIDYGIGLTKVGSIFHKKNFKSLDCQFDLKD